MKTLGKIRLSGDIFSLPIMLEFVSTHARGCGLCKERTSEVLRAVEEAVSNIIDESYQNAYGEIDLTCEEDSMARLIITIADSAPPVRYSGGDRRGPGARRNCRWRRRKALHCINGANSSTTSPMRGGKTGTC